MIRLGNRGGVIVVYIDFAKAFDCVSHQKLLYKLENYGLFGNLLTGLNYCHQSPFSLLKLVLRFHHTNVLLVCYSVVSVQLFRYTAVSHKC